MLISHRLPALRKPGGGFLFGVLDIFGFVREEMGKDMSAYEIHDPNDAYSRQCENYGGQLFIALLYDGIEQNRENR
jgi:hypothetical protein